MSKKSYADIIPPDIANSLVDLLGEIQLTPEQAHVFLHGLACLKAAENMSGIEKLAIKTKANKDVTSYIASHATLRLLTFAIRKAIPECAIEAQNVFKIMIEAADMARKKQRAETNKDLN